MATSADAYATHGARTSPCRIHSIGQGLRPAETARWFFVVCIGPSSRGASEQTCGLHGYPARRMRRQFPARYLENRQTDTDSARMRSCRTLDLPPSCNDYENGSASTDTIRPSLRA